MAMKKYSIELNAKHNFNEVEQAAISAGATIDKSFEDRLMKIGFDTSKGDINGFFKFLDALKKADPSKIIQANLDMQTTKLEKLTSELKEYQDLLDAKHGGQNTFRDYINAEARKIGMEIVKGTSPEELLPKYQMLLNLVESFQKEGMNLPLLKDLDEIGMKFFDNINPDSFKPIGTIFQDAQKHVYSLQGQISGLKESITDLERIQANPDSFVKNYERLASIGSTLKAIEISPLDENISPEEFADGLLKMADSYDKIIERIHTLQNSGDNSGQVKEEIGLLYNLANAYEKAFDISNEFNVAGEATDLLPDDWMSRLINNRKLRDEVGPAAKEFRQIIGEAINEATSSSDTETQEEISKWLNSQINLRAAMTDLFTTDYAEFFKSLSYGFESASSSAKATEDDIKSLAEEFKKLHREEQIRKDIENLSVEDASSVKSPKQKGAIMSDLNSRYEKVNAAIIELEQQDDGSDEIKEKLLMLKGLRQKIVEAFNNSFPKSILAADDYVKREDWLKKNVGEEAEKWALNQRSIIEGILNEHLGSADFWQRRVAFDDKMDSFDLKSLDLGVDLSQIALDGRAALESLVASIMSDTDATEKNTEAHKENNAAKQDGQSAGDGTQESTDQTAKDTEATEKNTEAHKENTNAKQEGASAGAGFDDGAGRMDKDTESTEKNTEAHKENADTKKESASAGSGSGDDTGGMDRDTESTEKNTQAHRDNNEERAKGASGEGSWSAESFEKINTILDSISSSLDNISKSIGTVDDDAGLNNLIQSLKTVNDLMDQISKKDFNLVFNEADKSFDTKTLLDKEINKLYQRYSKAYDDIVKAGWSEGSTVGPETVLATIWGNNYERTGYSSYSGFFDTFDKSALKQLSPKEYIARVQELIKYVKATIADAENVYDKETLARLKELKLPTDDTQLVQRRLADLTKPKTKTNAQEVLRNALDRSAQQSSAGVNTEADAMGQVADLADAAAKAKEKFVEANSGVGASSTESAGKLKEEADAMEAIADAQKQSDGFTDQANALYMRQIENYRKFMADGLAETYIPNIADQLKQQINSIGETGDLVGLVDFPNKLDAAKRSLKEVMSGPDQLQKRVSKLQSELKEFGSNVNVQQLMGSELQNLEALSKNAVDYDSAQKFADALRSAKEEYKQLTKIQEGQQRQADKLKQQWADVVNEAFDFSQKVLGDYDGVGSIKNAAGDTLAKRVHTELEDAINGDVTEESIARIRASLQSLKAEADGALGGMKKDALDIISRLKGNKSQYLKNFGGVRTDEGGNPIPGSKSVLNDLTAYEENIRALDSLVAELNQRWGENASEVKAASSAAETYKTSLTHDIISQIRQRASEQLTTTNRALTEIKTNKGTSFTPEYEGTLRKIIDDNTKILSQLDEMDSAKPFANMEMDKFLDMTKKMSQGLDEAQASLKGIASPSNIQALVGQIDGLLSKVNEDLSKGLSGKLKKDYEDLRDELEKYKAALLDTSTAQEAFSKMDFKRYAQAQKELHNTMIASGQKGGSFQNKFAEAINNQSAQFLATYFSFQDMIRYAREITSTVVQTDSALIELKKVSDASNERIQQSFTKSAETAQELGATITDVINSTSTWARLGYDVDAAEDLARTSVLFQTVGDNMTQETASESLVSTLKGFQMDADQAMSIVDKFNEVLAARLYQNANKDRMRVEFVINNNTLKLLEHPKANLPIRRRKSEKSSWMLYGEIKAFQGTSYVA